jgi:hypothetical protein
MSYSNSIPEEELKNKVGEDYFSDFDHTIRPGAIDFAVAEREEPTPYNEHKYFLWAEAKKGNKADIVESFIQLILTIGKARTFNDNVPPTYLGAFDAEKIAFLPYHLMMGIFSENDFNWNATPSNHHSAEFNKLQQLIGSELKSHLLIFYYDKDDKELRHFIKANFKGAGKEQKLNVNKNNFTYVYKKWAEQVKPTIQVNWDALKKQGVLDGHFFLADLLSKDNCTLKEKLFVVLQKNHYELGRKKDENGLFVSSQANFNDKQMAHTLFWNHYNRPPKQEYWDYIVNRQDLLVPQDVRERKGSYFTPAVWVEKSQQYLAEELGENWQDEYYIWDCCAGVGNLLAGLVDKYKIWASTLEQADVDVMHDRIANGANLLDNHVFKFDFLNDDFDDLPYGLKRIIRDDEKRKHLLIYMNPPYAEAGNRKVIVGKETQQKTNVATQNATYKKYSKIIGIAARELFAQFMYRIYDEIPGCVIGQFSTLKIQQAPNFKEFRKSFQAKLCRSFVVPADTFDNVKGKFPIGFFIWRLSEKEVFKQTVTDVYNKDAILIDHKTLSANDNKPSINDWLIETRKRFNGMKIGFLSCRSHDMSNVNYNFIINDTSQMSSPRGTWITDKNIKEASIYLAVCHCIEPTWLNDRDQFFYPNDGWKEDKEFQSDCLIYTLFSGQNRISTLYGPNYWIPFTEKEVDAKDNFSNNFMSNYLKGIAQNTPISKNKPVVQGNLFSQTDNKANAQKACLSSEAQAVFDAGRELWRYYHAQPDANPNASYYDIRFFFQGTKTTDKGKVVMNTESNDENYTRLIHRLRAAHSKLAAKIRPKVYEYGFLEK